MDTELLSAGSLWCLPPNRMLLHCLTVSTGGQSEEGAVSAVPQQMQSVFVLIHLIFC